MHVYIYIYTVYIYTSICQMWLTCYCTYITIYGKLKWNVYKIWSENWDDKNIFWWKNLSTKIVLYTSVMNFLLKYDNYGQYKIYLQKPWFLTTKPTLLIILVTVEQHTRHDIYSKATNTAAQLFAFAKPETPLAIVSCRLAPSHHIIRCRIDSSSVITNKPHSFVIKRVLFLFINVNTRTLPSAKVGYFDQVLICCIAYLMFANPDSGWDRAACSETWVFSN